MTTDEERGWPGLDIVHDLAQSRFQAQEEAFNSMRHTVGVLMGGAIAVVVLLVTLGPGNWYLVGAFLALVSAAFSMVGLWPYNWTIPPESELRLTKVEEVPLKYQLLMDLNEAFTDNERALTDLRTHGRWASFFLATSLVLVLLVAALD